MYVSMLLLGWSEVLLIVTVRRIRCKKTTKFFNLTQFNCASR